MNKLIGRVFINPNRYPWEKIPRHESKNKNKETPEYTPKVVPEKDLHQKDKISA
jgi:hypothetical protein